MSHAIVPQSPYPESPYLVAQPLVWDGTSRPATVIVATDGTERSDGAVRAAIASSEATGAVIEVLTVVRNEPVSSPDGAYYPPADSLEQRRMQREIVETQLDRITNGKRTQSVTVLEGNPAYTISRVAIERRAALLIVGQGRHTLSDRLFSDETALQLARITRVPLLAVPEDQLAPPSHVVVAVDFGEISDRAAQAAIDALATGGQIDLVHALPHVLEDPFTIAPKEPAIAWAEGQLAALERRLVIPPGVTVKSAIVRGRPATALLEYAARVHADMIVTGTHGRGFVARAVLGSVASKLLRGARCPLLIVPRDPLPALRPAERGAACGAPQRGSFWADQLTQFTRRNIGRLTAIEADDLEMHAQAQSYNYPLVSATYDARNARVDLQVGDNRTKGVSVTRSLGNIVSVDVLTDGQGNDEALRITHGSSQTLLTFAR